MTVSQEASSDRNLIRNLTHADISACVTGKKEGISVDVVKELLRIETNDRSKFSILGSKPGYYNLIGGISGDDAAELEKELKKLGLQRDKVGQKVQVDKVVKSESGKEDESESEYVLHLGTEERKIFFSGKTAIQSLALIICMSFAKHDVLLKKFYGQTVSAFTLNLDELIYLQCLYKAVNSFEADGEYDAEQLRREIVSCTAEACKHAPLFSRQAICCDNSAGLWARLTKKSLRSGQLWEFANEKFYSSKLRNAVEVFKEFSCILDEYRELVKIICNSQIVDCANMLENKLVFEVPIKCLKLTLEALSSMNGRYSAEIEEEICTALSETVNADSAQARDCFEKVDKAFEKLLVEKLADTYCEVALSKIASDLLTDASKARKQDCSSMMSSIHNRFSQLLDIHYFDLKSLSDYSLGWKHIDEFTADKVLKRKEQWTEERLDALFSHAQGHMIHGKNINLWLIDSSLSTSRFNGTSVEPVLFGGSSTIIGINILQKASEVKHGD